MKTNIIAFKVTVEFYCYNMIEAEVLKNEYNGDPMLAYKDISDNFNDSPLNFSQSDRIVSVEILPPDFGG